nr:MAG TPA: hypothetical protein [Caudoviricetes sp.]
MCSFTRNPTAIYTRGLWVSGSSPLLPTSIQLMGR